MMKLVSSFSMSVDGVVESPERFQSQYFDEEMEASLVRSIESTRAYLMGRVLYEEWSAYWPTEASGNPFTAFINDVDKYVVSDSLTTALWHNTTVVSGDVAARLGELKTSGSGDLGICGSATLVRWLLEHRLIDELNLQVYPVLMGRGRRLFEGESTHALTLVEREAFGNGVLNLKYVPATR